MDDLTARIQCSIFRAQEEHVQRLTEQINQARSVVGKAPLAKELCQSARDLLDCEKYQDYSLDCAYCQQFSKLRRKTAQLILVARRLVH